MSLAPPLATAVQLGAYMRTTFSGDALTQAEMVLQVVSAWARTVGGRAWGPELLPPDDVVGVVLSAARRELTNPDRVISEHMGPLSVTWAPPPDDFFTAGEMAILRRKSGGGLYTISTRREEPGWGDGYLHMVADLSDEPLPYLPYGEPGWDSTVHP